MTLRLKVEAIYEIAAAEVEDPFMAKLMSYLEYDADRKQTQSIKSMELGHRVAKALGMPICKEPDRIAWNGRCLTISRIENLSNYLHDIAHFQLCSDRRLNMPDYGLGPSPDTDPKIHFKHARHPKNEEEQASVLGILWEMSLGLGVQKTLDYQAWNLPEDAKAMSKIVRELQAEGLVGQDFKPRAVRSKKCRVKASLVD